MNRNLLYSSAVWMILAIAPASAAVFERDWKAPGDGLLTFDDVNQREWLDLSVSRLDQFPEPRLENAIAEIGPGGVFEGFTFANRQDVLSLAQSAGIDTSTENFAINESAAASLIELLGMTAAFSTGTVHSIHSVGLINETEGSPPFGPRQVGADIFRRFNSVTGQGASAGVVVSASNDVLHLRAPGIMLYRVIPEPPTVCLAVLSISVLACVAFSRWRRIGH